MLSVRGLGRRFDRRWLFRSLDFDLSPGDRLGVFGPNGCGKSTLLRILAGLLRPSEGEVLRPVGERREIIGLHGLDMSLYGPLTAREHLEFVAGLRGTPCRVEMLDAVGLADAHDRPASQMSTGMKARLKLAMATHHRPPILLLDEPTAALDESGREIVRAVVRDHSEHGVVVFASNDPHDRSMATHELAI